MAFPAVKLIDSFHRAKEVPLGAKAAWNKWKIIPWSSPVKGMEVIEESLMTNRAVNSEGHTQGDYVSTINWKEPCVLLHQKKPFISLAHNEAIRLWVCLNTSTHSGYAVTARPYESEVETVQIVLERWDAGVPHVLGTFLQNVFGGPFETVRFQNIGISVLAGKVVAWFKPLEGGEPFEVITVADATYKEGTIGIEGDGVAHTWDNFEGLQQTVPTVTKPATQKSNEGVPISGLQMEAVGAESWTAGVLPEGLSINASTGLITGTPKKVQTVTAKVTATNTYGSTTVEFEWKVEAPVAPTVTKPADQTDEQEEAGGIGITPLKIEATNTVEWKATGLPAGLVLNSTTGVVTGAPTNAEVTTVNVTVKGPGGIATTSFKWTITTTKPTITKPADQKSTVGRPVAELHVASQFATKFKATGLPSGLAINATTGAIFGSPAVVEAPTVTITAENSAGTASTSFKWTIVAAPPLVTAAMITRDQLPVYKHAAPAVNDMVALGQRSKILYGGLVLNDRLRPDRYVVTKIGPLGGAEIRDSRQPRPADHGELPYGAFFGGKTITIDGTIEAGSLAQLAVMERELRAAFATLRESPLQFNWWDVEDGFWDPITSQAFWKPLIGPAPTFSGNGTMSFTGTEGGTAYYALRQYIDEAITVKLTFLSPTADGRAGIVLGTTSSESYVACVLRRQLGGYTLEVVLIEPTGPTVVSSTPISLGSNVTGIWLQARTVDDSLEVAVYGRDPIEQPTVPIAFAQPESYGIGNEEFESEPRIALVGAGAQRFGALKPGFAGVTTENATFCIFEDFSVEASWPGDFVTMARPFGNGVQINDAYQAKLDRYTQDFQASVRASKPQWQGGQVQVATFGTEATGVVTVRNRGNWIAPLKLLISSVGTGILPNPRVNNLTTGEVFSLLLGTTLKEGEGILIDSEKHTITSYPGGANMFHLFSPSAKWPALAPGDNQFLIESSEGWRRVASFVWRHTWAA